MSQAELNVEGGERQDKLVGQTIDGRYLVEKVLGEGGMGLVYKAKHVVLNKPLALKVLRPDVSRDEEIITRFRQEAQSASAIGNQHIIDISDFGVLPNGATYFVMEFLDGTDLTGVIEGSRPGVDAARTVHVAKQLCNALGAAHDVGIVHRDLKPDNIYLIRRGNDSNFVKVLDFGIAKVGGNSSKLTRAGQVFGTPHYMSPEQCAGSGVDHRTDVYAVGIILYEMVTGQTPFDADNLMGILTKHLYEPPVPPRQHNPAIPEELELVILKAIAKDRAQRYQNMYELLEDLQRLEQGVSTVALETARNVLVDPTGERSVPNKGRGALVAGLVVLLLGGGGTGAYLALGGEAETDPQVVQSAVAQQAASSETPRAADLAREASTSGASTSGASTSGASTTETSPTTGAAGTSEATEALRPAQVMVRVASEPEAEVWREAEYVGRTPVEVARPTGDERIELELRAEGFEDRRFVISSLTSTEISFRLERVRGASSRMSSSMASAARSTAMGTPPPSMGTSMGSSMRSGSEVLDPWANE